LSLSVGRDKPTTIAEAVTDIEARTATPWILDVVRCLIGLLLIVARWSSRCGRYARRRDLLGRPWLVRRRRPLGAGGE
jgi:hypothetical protein